MKKNRQAASSTDSRTNRTPPVLTPAVLSVSGEVFRITDPQFAELENLGGIKLAEKQRVRLLTLADFWINDLRLRRSARPKQFRKNFDKMAKAFEAAEKECQWDRHQRHLMHWTMEQAVKGADGFPVTLAELEQHLKTVREFVLALRQCLPPDPGRQRPFDDERRIIYLADVFEEAGGKATAYSSAYAEKGSMADTPFRRFARYYYSLLPADDRRDPGGLDEALRLALMARSPKSAS